MFVEIFDTASGPLSIVFDDEDTLYHLDFPDQGDRQNKLLSKRFGKINLTKGESSTIKSKILAYFEGDFQALDQISCCLGGTSFQRRVWDALKSIPCGETRSYKEMACQIGQVTAVRAVARANALNPVSLIYPCHRVIGSNGDLRGYAGGLDRKNWLLRHEGCI